MPYDTKPKMILFDVGGTLFDDGKCQPADGLSKLRLAAINPDVTSDAALTALWNEYMDEVDIGLTSRSGISLDPPLSAALKYVTLHAGLQFELSMAEQEEIFDRYNSSRSVVDGVPELLDALETAGIRTAVISNNAMSGDGLALAIQRWIPNAKMEFFLTSADLLFKKPSKTLFTAAAAYAHLCPSDCWYCGDGFLPDVCGAKNGGMTPVLYEEEAALPFEKRSDSTTGTYLTVNHWNVLKKHILGL